MKSTISAAAAVFILATGVASAQVPDFGNVVMTSQGGHCKSVLFRSTDSSSPFFGKETWMQIAPVGGAVPHDPTEVLGGLIIAGLSQTSGRSVTVVTGLSQPVSNCTPNGNHTVTGVGGFVLQ